MTTKAMSNPTCPNCKKELNKVHCHYYYSEETTLKDGKAVKYGEWTVGDFIDATCDNCGEDVSELIELPPLDQEEEK